MKLGPLGTDILIPKLNREGGCKKHGYSLQVILSWDNTAYQVLRKRVKGKVNNYLDHTHSMSNQPHGPMKKLAKLVGVIVVGIIQSY